MRDPHEVIKEPLVTEKSTRLKELEQTVAFRVDGRANKKEIKAAVEKLFNVKVEQVRVANFSGKPKRQGRFQGHRADWKKAYVKLKPGQRIEILETA